MNKKVVAATLLAIGLASSGKAIAQIPPEFEYGCEYGEYDHVFHAIENKEFVIEGLMFALHLSPERAAWEEYDGYNISRVCVQLDCEEQTDEWVWLFGTGDNMISVTVDYCQIDLVALSVSEEYNVYLPIILR